MDKDMEKKFITQDDALGFLEDFMNISEQSRPLGCRLVIADNPDGTFDLRFSSGPNPVRSITIIPDDNTLGAKSAMKYLLEENGDE